MTLYNVRAESTMSMVGDGCGFATLEVGLSYMLVTILLTYSPVTRVKPYPRRARQAMLISTSVSWLFVRTRRSMRISHSLVVLFERH